MRLHRALAAVAALGLATVSFTACSSDSSEQADTTATPTTECAPAGQDAGASASTQAASTAVATQFPITIEHALGSATIPSKPERVATVNWANHEVPLALGVVPVGMARADFGDDDGNGVLPWVEEKLEELGAPTPVLFDETDGIDFEAVSDSDPDVILAAYSGLTQEDYDKLSGIVPVVAYPEGPWATSWRDIIRFNSKGLGLEQEGNELIARLEGNVAAEVAKHPELECKTAMFVTHVDTSDLSTMNFYTTVDTRAAFFSDLGLRAPAAVAEAAKSGAFSGSVSTEQIDQFEDVDVIVTYGNQKLVDDLKADPLFAQLPAVKNDAIVFLDGTGPMGTAANPTPLSIDWVLSDYVSSIANALSDGN